MLCTQTLSWTHFAVFKCCSVYQPSQEKVLFSYCNKWIFRKYKADVIMLQETKKPWISRQSFRSFGREEIKTGFILHLDQQEAC